MSKKIYRRLLITITVLLLIIAAIIVADANRRGNDMTAGLREIIDRQSTSNPP